MSFRFRRSVRIAKGVRLNFGSRGASLSALGFNVGSRGVSAGFSIPGTGLSYRSSVARFPTRTQLDRQARVQQRLAMLEEKVEALKERQRALSNVSLSIEDDGTLILRDANGFELRGKELTMAWEQHGDKLTDVLEEKAHEISGDVEVIRGIHLDTPNPSVPRSYQRVPFTEPAPPLPRDEGFASTKPMRRYVTPLGFMAKLFRSQREKHAAAVQAAETEYEREMSRWSSARDAVAERNAQAKTAYGVALEAWERRKGEHEAREAAKEAAHASRITTDPDYMELILEQALEDLEWPRETDVALDFADGGRSVWLDVDLPEIEDFPSRVATLSSNGRRLLIKDKTERTLREEYARHVHGIALRVAGVAFWTLPAAEKVVLSGYSQRPNKATGQTEDEYLYSVIFDREGFQRIDFTKLRAVDPVEALARFPLRRTMTATGIFKPIEPFAESEDQT